MSEDGDFPPFWLKFEVKLINYDKILADLKIELESSIDYLKYSFEKINKKSINSNSTSPEDLETYEALVSRFARTTDIFVAKYLRSFVLKDDPAFSGSLIDTINYAEKKGLIVSAKNWIEIRELRNKISHEYTAADLKIIFDQVMLLTPEVLEIRKKI